ncbi:MAG: nucleotidyltransferase family protein [Planctomycetota bacterium]|nr:MAG: nucleotidyltransferase family protein [Planctomycetota bacterium]
MEGSTDITAAILAGGLGRRLQPVVSDRPKVLAEVSGKPFLAYLLEQISSVGVRKAVICTGYMGDKIEECFGEAYESLGIVYSREDEPLGTGGALRLALPYLSSDIILVMNGDSYINTDLSVYVDWYFERKLQAALLLSLADDTSRYGSVRINENKTVASFEEKCENSGPGWINAGIYLLRKSLISTIPAGRFYSLERDFFPKFMGSELYGFCVKGRFIDIGTPESYVTAQKFFATEGF